tara:strand:+ start:1909 stop:2676 length:768 start_codon:yes stop_codon:yes gene_type:complete
MKKIVVIIFLLAFIQTLTAQNTVFEEKRTIYKKEESFGAIIHTRGWGLTYRYGKYTSGFTRRIYEVDFVGMKHPKQIKSFSSAFDNSNGYVFGQLNSIMILRVGIGRHNTFISKQSVRGISISSILSGGLSIAYAKPVYLEVIKVDSVTSELSSEVERFNPDIHLQGEIIGKASYFRGFFNGKLFPGVFAKYALSFESSRQANRINALEVGAILDVYVQKMPMMANDFNKRYFFNLYVSLTFGAKKTAKDIGKSK